MTTKQITLPQNILYPALLKQAEAMLDRIDAEDRTFTFSEQEDYDKIIAQLETLKSGMKGSARRPDFGQPSNEISDLPYAAPHSSRSMPTFHAGARTIAFANNRDGHAQAYRSGQWLRGALLGDPKALNWCQNNGMAIDVMAAHSAGSNVAGGVLVPEEFSSTIIRLVEQYGCFRRNTRVVPMSTDTLNIPRRTGGLTASYVGEGVAGNSTDTAWDNVQLVAKKLMVLSRLSSEIEEDALISMVDMLALECAYAFALKEDTVGFTGDGSATSGGIVGVLVKAIDSAHTKAKVAAASTHDTLAEITSTDVIKLMSAIPAYAKAGSKFYCSPTALDLIFNAIKVGAGGNSLENLQNQVQPFFLGYPVEVSPVFADDAAATYNGAVMIGFGNLAMASTLGSRRELRFATTDQKYWEEDQIGVKATLRHDIVVNDLGSTAAKSPFAVLVGTT